MLYGAIFIETCSLYANTVKVRKQGTSIGPTFFIQISEVFQNYIISLAQHYVKVHYYSKSFQYICITEIGCIFTNNINITAVCVYITAVCVYITSVCVYITSICVYITAVCVKYQNRWQFVIRSTQHMISHRLLS